MKDPRSACEYVTDSITKEAGVGKWMIPLGLIGGFGMMLKSGKEAITEAQKGTKGMGNSGIGNLHNSITHNAVEANKVSNDGAGG